MNLFSLCNCSQCVMRLTAFSLIFAAQCRAPFAEKAFAILPQSSSQQTTRSRSQKVANPVNEWIAEAQRDIDKGDFEAAIAPLQKIIADQPDLAYAHFQLAYAYTALKRIDNARPEYERAIAIDPKMSEAHLNLGILLLERDPAAAISPLRKAVELLPTQSRPRFLLGAAQERSGDATAAIASFESALRLDPRDLDTALHLGNLYLNLNRPADAETKFRGVLAADPKEPRALSGLARSLDAQKKPEAVEAYRNYLNSQPDDAAARERVVRLLMDQQQYDAALAEIDRAAPGSSPSADSLRLRADILVAQKKWDDAIATLQRALTLAPNDAQLHGGLGRLYMQKRNFPSAESELKIAIQLDRKNTTYWKDLGSAYYLNENYPAAIAMLDQVAKIETPNAGSWFIRALCYDKLNQPEPALEAYQKFLALDQDKNSNQVWQATERSKVLRKVLERKR